MTDMTRKIILENNNWQKTVANNHNNNYTISHLNIEDDFFLLLFSDLFTIYTQFIS